jgi:hypothetical protein
MITPLILFLYLIHQFWYLRTRKVFRHAPFWERRMPKSLRTKRHRALTSVLRATRIEHELTQRELSARPRRAPNYIAKIEIGERRLDTVVLFTRVARW